MTIEEMFQWLEESIEQGNELGHNTKPITQVVSKLRAAEALCKKLNDMERNAAVAGCWFELDDYEKAGNGQVT